MFGLFASEDYGEHNGFSLVEICEMLVIQDCFSLCMSDNTKLVAIFLCKKTHRSLNMFPETYFFPDA